jgi:hypothetical protein
MSDIGGFVRHDMSTSTHTRFTGKETAQLVGIAAATEFTAKHAARAESLRWEELTTDEYELSIAEDYRSQVRSLHSHFQRLMDLRLEQDKDNAGRMSAASRMAGRYYVHCRPS